MRVSSASDIVTLLLALRCSWGKEGKPRGKSVTERDVSGWNVFVGRCVPSSSRARRSDQVNGGQTVVSLGPTAGPRGLELPGSPSCALQSQTAQAGLCVVSLGGHLGEKPPAPILRGLLNRGFPPQIFFAFAKQCQGKSFLPTLGQAAFTEGTGGWWRW